jgi:putative ABC transport system ATP-binding protein
VGNATARSNDFCTTERYEDDMAEQQPKTIAARMEHGSKVYVIGGTEVRALDDVSIAFEASCFTAIMGPSGSGKSTLMHCLAGLDDLSSGAAYIGVENVTGMNERQRTKLRREKIGFIFQSFNLIPTLNAIENIMLPERLAKTDVDKSWFEQVISKVHLGDRLTHTPNELSGGQQQRVAVARAMVAKPQIIFADEPTGNLDSKVGAEILRFMRSAVDEFGQTIVMVSHDPVAASYADRIVFLADGEIVDEMVNPTAAAILDHLKQLDPTIVGEALEPNLVDVKVPVVVGSRSVGS